MPTYLTIYYEQMDTWMTVLTVADRILFMLFLISVVYLALFSFLSMFSEGKRYKVARRRSRFAVLLPVYTPDDNLRATIASLAAQDYPRESFDIIVLAPETIPKWTSQLDVKTVEVGRERFSKTGAIVQAMSSFDAKAYDIAVVMDPGNIVDSDFLTELNNAFASGCKAVQAHCKAKSALTDTALFEAASQEINNSIFRRGHVRVGLSSALAGSGMAFDFKWLRQHAEKIQGDGLEKQLEIMLHEQGVFIEYMNNVSVYEDKAELPAEFYQERGRWMSERLENIRMAVTRLPKALLSFNMDYCDKLFQWIIPSRTILLGELSIISAALLFVSWPMSLKWFGLLFLLIFSFSMAMPDYMIDARFVKAVKTMPLLFMLTVFNVFRKRVFKARKPEPKATA